MKYDEILHTIDLRIDKYNKYYKFDFFGIRIKKMKTRWGSCSSKKNLNFNSRIIELSDQLIDYIVVHELCHLKEMNHSRRFWMLVGETIPDYKKLKEELRRFTLKR